MDGNDLISTSRTTINTNFSNLNTDKQEGSALDDDATFAANSATKYPSQRATKLYVDTGGNVNASETARGIAEEATDAEVTAGTATGATGAKLFVTPAKLATRLASSTSFGDGSDGDVTISAGTTTLIRDMYYNNLIVTGTLATAGYRVFVNGTISGAGIISFNGTAGGNGGNGSGGIGGTAGTAAAATVGYFSTSAGAPGVAGISGVNNAAGGTSASAVANALVVTAGGNGGKGGRSDAGAGGAPSGGTGATGTAVVTKFGQILFQTVAGLDVTAPGSLIKYKPGGGGGSGGVGGAQSASSSGGSGGGGASGGIIALFVKIWTGTFTFQATGGNGGNAGTCEGTNAGGSAGGGGGSGGFVFITYGTKTWTGSYTLTGGIAGTSATKIGSGQADQTNGTDGGSGTSLEISISNLL